MRAKCQFKIYEYILCKYKSHLQKARGGSSHFRTEYHPPSVGYGHRHETGQKPHGGAQHAEHALSQIVGDDGGPTARFEQGDDIFAGFQEGVAVETDKDVRPLMKRNREI